jgi:DNA-binding response OmpR family regulator
MPRKGRPVPPKPPAPSKEPQFLCCPSCGFDLVKARPVRIGELYADPMGETYWKGKQVPLNANFRLILSGILLASQSNKPALKLALAERADVGLDSVDVFICKLRDKFKQVDPDFNHIETVWGEGYKWSETPVRQTILSFPQIPLVIYDNGECHWQNRYLVKLAMSRGKNNQVKVLKALAEARGDFLNIDKIQEITGIPGRHGVYIVVQSIMDRFAETDPKSRIIINHPRRGYAICKPDWQKPVWTRTREGQTRFELTGVLAFRADGEVFWQNKHRIFLTEYESRLFDILLQADGAWVSSKEVRSKAGELGQSMKTLGMSVAAVKQLMTKIKKKFEAAEPGQTFFQTMPNVGYRLKLPISDKQKLFETDDLVAYKSGLIKWQDIYEFELSPKRLHVLKAIAEDGGWIRGSEVAEMLPTGPVSPGAISSLVKALRETFAEHDPNVTVITSHEDNGYRFVPISEQRQTEYEEVRLVA